MTFEQTEGYIIALKEMLEIVNRQIEHYEYALSESASAMSEAAENESL